MSIVSNLLLFETAGCRVYGILPYFSRYAIYTEKYRQFLPYQKFMGMVYNFKKNSKNAELFERVICQVSRELNCDMIVAIPSSTAGKINSLQTIFGVTIQRDVSTAQRKYNHNAEPDEAGKIHLAQNVAGKSILLVDDVATTGKSLLYFRKFLLAAGARRVEMLGVGISLSKLDMLPDIETIERMIAEAKGDNRKCLSEICVTTGELADLFGVDAAAISQMCRRGTLTCRREDKKFMLVDAVHEYCTALRWHYKQPEASNSGAEFEYWRTQKVKQQSTEGRAQICEEIMATLLKVWHEIGDRLQARFSRGRESEIIKEIFDTFETTAKSIDLKGIEDFEQGNIMENDNETEEKQDNI